MTDTSDTQNPTASADYEENMVWPQRLIDKIGFRIIADKEALGEEAYKDYCLDIKESLQDLWHSEARLVVFLNLIDDHPDNYPDGIVPVDAMNPDALELLKARVQEAIQTAQTQGEEPYPDIIELQASRMIPMQDEAVLLVFITNDYQLRRENTSLREAIEKVKNTLAPSLENLEPRKLEALHHALPARWAVESSGPYMELRIHDGMPIEKLVNDLQNIEEHSRIYDAYLADISATEKGGLYHKHSDAFPGGMDLMSG